MKVNEKILQKASSIAHAWFWESDCPSILRKARKYIQSHTLPKENRLANYLVVICWICVQNWLDQME